MTATMAEEKKQPEVGFSPPSYGAHTHVPRTAADAQDIVDDDDAGATSPSSDEAEGDQPPAYDFVSVPNEKQQVTAATATASPTTARTVPGFNPTVHLQIQTPGKAWLSWPSPTPPDPVPISIVSSSEHSLSIGTGPGGSTPSFVSIRPERRSGSCSLYIGADLSPSHDALGGVDTSRAPALSSTTYRFGHGRPPRVQLFLPSVLSSASAPDNEEWDSFEVRSSGLLTRAVQFRTRHLGDFEWRYGDKKERRAAGADNLLVLERVVPTNNTTTTSSSKMKSKDGSSKRVVVACLVRSEEHRDPDSRRSSAGNGGRLQVDLSGWDKHHKDMALATAVTTCLVMLKREVDRRREQQIAIMASG